MNSPQTIPTGKFYSSHWFLRLLPHPGTVLSSLLIVFAFTPWDVLPLIAFCLVPWFWALGSIPYGPGAHRRAIKEGLWLSIGMSLGGFHWVAYVLNQFTGYGWGFATLGLVLYSCIGQPQFTILGPFFRYFLHALTSRGGRLAPLQGLGILIALSLFYSGYDWLIPNLFVDTLGHSFYSAKWIRQVADLGGAALLTFLVLFTNLTIYWVGYSLFVWSDRRSWVPAAIVLAALWLSASIYGKIRYEQATALVAQAPRSVQFAVIQANIGDLDKLASERGLRSAANAVLSSYFSLTDQALTLAPKPEVIVWPETAFPSTFRSPDSADELMRDRQLEAFVRDRKIPLIFGGYDRYRGKDHNVMFYMMPEPTTGYESAYQDLRVYRKNKLLLFGEYIPGAETFPSIKRAFPQVGHFGRGPGPEMIELPIKQQPELGSIKTGPVICYEILFPEFVLEAVRKGSQLILNVTNDSWFGPVGEPQLHLSLSTFRSVEARMPTLRATNTGISALIQPNGDIVHQTALFEPEIMNVAVPVVGPMPTVLLAWGDWFGIFGMVSGTVGMTLFYRRSRARKL